MKRKKLSYVKEWIFHLPLLQIGSGLLLVFLFAGLILLQDSIVKLHTSDNTSSFKVTKSDDSILLNVRADGNVGIREDNPSTALEVDGSVTAKQYKGDGSQLSNVRPIAAYTGGDMRFQLSTSDQVIRNVNITVPAEGHIRVMATGCVDWESKKTDWGQFSISQGTNLETDYMTEITDYGCTDSSDQYASLSLERGYTVASSGTYTFNLVGSIPADTNKVELKDVVISAMYFPTGSVVVANPKELPVAEPDKGKSSAAQEQKK